MNIKMELKQNAGFVSKLSAILQNEQLESIISWSRNGHSFIIHNATAFQEQVLRRYYRHRRLNSFIRQLNMYDFHKIRSTKDWLQFHHPFFTKNNPSNYCLIDRKKVTFLQSKLQQCPSKAEFDEITTLFSSIISIKLIQDEQQPSFGTKFCLNSSEMSIRLNENLTSLCQLDLDDDHHEQSHRQSFKVHDEATWIRQEEDYLETLLSKSYKGIDMFSE